MDEHYFTLSYAATCWLNSGTTPKRSRPRQLKKKNLSQKHKNKIQTVRNMIFIFYFGRNKPD